MRIKDNLTWYEKINFKWFNDSPFFFQMLSRMRFIKSEEVPSIGISMRNYGLTIIYNEGFIESLTESQQEGVIVHELMHLLLKFKARLGNRNFKFFNIAQDIVINEEIMQMSIGNRSLDLPPNGCFLKDIPDYDSALLTEPIYDHLLQNAEVEEPSMSGGGGSGDGSDGDESGSDDDESESDGDGSGSDGDGSGSGSDGDENQQNGKKKVKTWDVHDFLEELEKNPDLAREAILEIKNMISAAQNSGYGNISNNAKEMIDRYTKSRIHWKNLINTHILQTDARMKEIKQESWIKRNRRIKGLPGKKKTGTKIVVGIDTSGSTMFYYDLLNTFFSEIHFLSDKYEVEVVEFDCSIKKEPYQYKRGQKIEAEGGGGTCVQPLLDLYKDKRCQLVIFTDGEFNHDLNYYNLEVLWALSQDVPIKHGKKVIIQDV